jgi:hypothetical protein
MDRMAEYYESQCLRYILKNVIIKNLINMLEIKSNSK